MSDPRDFFGPSRAKTPIGSIAGIFRGYYTNTSNGGFKSLHENTLSRINDLVRPYGWWICNGTAPNDKDSPVWNSTTRRVPNLTGNVFVLGSGTIKKGGATTHHHSMPGHTLSGNEIPAHDHLLPISNNTGNAYWGADLLFTRPTPQYTYYTGGSRAHVHGNVGTSTANANVPNYLSVIYVIKIK